MSSRRLPRALVTLLALGLISGCSESTLPVAGVYHPTLIEVSPDEFLSGVPCSTAAGALQTYVATVFNVEYLPDGTAVPPPPAETDAGADTEPDAGADMEPDAGPDACPVDTSMAPGQTEGFALPSSNPIACTRPVAFSRVVPFHRYRAKIDGYAYALTDIEPLAPGASIMVAKATGEPVAPSWTFTCGARCPVTARSFVTRTLEDCQLDAGSVPAPSGPAAINLSLNLQPNAPPCGSESGQVDHFEVAFAGGTLSAACGESMTLSDVPTGGALNLPLLAYEAGNPDPRWGATCTASPVAGLTVDAHCPVLSAQGALDIEPEVALTALATDCQGLASLGGALELQLVDGNGVAVGQKRLVDATSCGASVRFTGVPSGPASAHARLLAAGAELGRALCNASVVPAQSVTATCAAEP